MSTEGFGNAVEDLSKGKNPDVEEVDENSLSDLWKSVRKGFYHFGRFVSGESWEPSHSEKRDEEAAEQ